MNPSRITIKLSKNTSNTTRTLPECPYSQGEKNIFFEIRGNKLKDLGNLFLHESCDIHTCVFINPLSEGTVQDAKRSDGSAWSTFEVYDTNRFYLIRKSFQEEWRLFHCYSTLGCGVIQDFD